jgi:2'-5' RNA ligase
VRLFVSAELPRGVVDALVAWRPRMEGLRAVAPESLHLTLAFLGERSEADAVAAAAVVREVAAPVGSLSLGAGRWLPARRPKVLAVDVVDGSGALGALQRAVVAGLEQAIGFAAEPRPFLPHVTVARVRRGVRVRAGDLGEVAGAGEFRATALSLMRSRLGEGPASYQALERVAL